MEVAEGLWVTVTKIFESGDLVLIGPELPHTWVSNDKLQGSLAAIVIPNIISL